MEDDKIKFTQTITDAIHDANIPKYYSNGFIFTSGNSDLVLLLQQNNKPIVAVNLSFTIAKTLAEKLTKLVANIEESAGQKFLTTTEIEEAIKKMASI